MQAQFSRRKAQGAPFAGDPGQAGDLDLRRIQRSLRQRARYRYVSPVVVKEQGGYRIVSPCCSRTVDTGGGTIDIARLEYDGKRHTWRLYSKNHASLEWAPHADGRLHEVLELLNRDPLRVFWQ